ncbi:MAG TPA: hypothetical protein VFH56_02795 [Acidimicrobiales bacterium]|nr:hypothetical protein [Acidimicrobiales bacterium]
MAQQAYAGQVSYSAAAARAVDDADSVVAPADRTDYNPANFASQPGAAARALGYPRQDGKPGRN